MFAVFFSSSLMDVRPPIYSQNQAQYFNRVRNSHPVSNMAISNNGLKFIGDHEGCDLTAYWDDLGGVWTIGYGHTGDVYEGETITQDQALELLRQDCQGAANAVNSYVTVPLTQNQFDALVSFTYNLGSGALASSTLLKLLNQGDYQGAADEFPKWCHAGGSFVQGLYNRRCDERDLFLS